MSEEIEVTDSISVSSRNIDFGEVYYAPAILSPSKLLEITNHSKVSVLLESKIHYSNQVEDFPVDLVLIRANEQTSIDPTVITIASGESITVQLHLSPNVDFFHKNNQNTSYYNISRRFHLIYHLSEGDYSSREVPLSFSAQLCTSIMFIDKTEVNFKLGTVKEVYYQEVMFWNRSESILEFSVESFNSGLAGNGHSASGTITTPSWLSNGSTMSSSSIVLCSGEDNQEIEELKIYQISSFAPMLVLVRITTQVSFITILIDHT